jgi:hypothetical protein
MSNRHKVFISFHSVDKAYKIEFERLFHSVYEIMVSYAVQESDISNYINTDTVRQKIRNEYLRDSTVTVVLVGKNTWQRKHVDWEISASLRSTIYSPRSGLIGIFLPTHPSYLLDNYNPYIIPPRLYDNAKCGFAKLYDWNSNPYQVQAWIHEAFLRRNTINPDNSYPNYVNNRSGERWQ